MSTSNIGYDTHTFCEEMSSCANCVVSITRLLQHFNLTNVCKFKQLLMKELACTDESQLWCRILPSLSEILTHESLTILKKQTMSLAEQQPSNLNKNISVYKQMQQNYKDRLSSLHSDVVDYLATFLDKKQSIELGYLNQQLYIETQKQSYLIKRCNDPMFSISDFTVDRFIWKQTNPFTYSLPQSIIVSVKTLAKFNYVNSLLQSSQWYKNIFRISNTFLCQNFSYLANIPIEIFFSKDGHFRDCKYSGRLPKIDQFSCILRENYDYTDLAMYTSVRTFCDNFDNYYLHNCACDINNIRCIKKLIIDEHLKHYGGDQGMRKEILLTLGPISHKIKINNSRISIDNVTQFKKIFHSNLDIFEFNDKSRVHINSNIKNKNLLHHDESYLTSLEFELSFVVNSYILVAHPFTTFMNRVITLGLEPRIKGFKLRLLKQPTDERLRVMLRRIFRISNNGVNGNDNDSNSDRDENNTYSNYNSTIGCQKRTLTIAIMTCGSNLWQLLNIFRFLTENSTQILDTMVNNISVIMFELSFAHDFEEHINPAQGHYSMLKSNYDYPIDENTIEYKDCDLSREQLDVLYQNVIKWLKNIQKEYGNDKLKEYHCLNLKLKKQMMIGV